MKILIAVHHFPPRYTGGAEWRAYRTAAALQARGHSVRVVCVERVDAGTGDGVSWEDGVYERVAVRRLSFNLTAAPDPSRWEYDNVWIGDHLQGWLDADQPDILHMIGGYLLSGRTLRVAQERRIPTVLSLTDFWFLCPRITLLRADKHLCTLPVPGAACARCQGEEKRRYRWPGRVAPRLMDAFWRGQQTPIRSVEARRAFLLQTLNQVDRIVSPSQFMLRTHVEAGVVPKRIGFSRQGHDFPGLKPELLEKAPGAVLRVGYLGQIDWLKGVHVLFEAVRQMPGAPLAVRVYGDTRPFPDYVRQLRRLAAGDGRLELAGRYPRAELSRVLQGLDVVVVPSVWYENSPNSILEALAHRTPVIASDLGGMAELVQDGQNGLLFAPGDPASLARQLQRLLDDPSLLGKLRAGIRPIKTLAEEMDELEEVYRAVGGVRQGARPNQMIEANDNVKAQAQEEK